MAQILGIDPDAVVGKLLRVWAWFDEQTENGNAPSVTQALLDRNVGVTGFVTAMLQVGWLIEDEHGLSVPNFERHNGHTAKKRVLTAKRVAESRGNSSDVTPMKQKCNAASVTPALAREEKRREEKNTNTIPPKSPKGERSVFDFASLELPEQIRTEAMQDAWLRWGKHRREIRKPLTQTQCLEQLRQFADWGEARSVAAINHTIIKGWQGIVEPDQSSSTTQGERKSNRELIFGARV